MIIETETGQRLELPDGSTPAQIDEVLSDFTSRQGPPTPEQPATTQNEPKTSFIEKITPNKDTPGAIWEGIKSGGVPFSDEIQAGIAAATSAPFVDDLSFQEAYKQAKYGNEDVTGFLQQRENAAQNNPGAYYTGVGTGAITTGIGATKAAAKLAPRAAQFAIRNPLTAAAGAGGVSGSIYAAGDAEGTPEEVARQARLGGAFGMLAGPALSVLGSRVAGPLASRAAKIFGKKPPSPQISGQPLNEMLATIEDNVPVEAMTFANAQANTRAMQKVVDAVKKDFPDTYNDVLAAWKDSDVPLAKLYGSQTGSLAKGAAQYPGGKAVTEKYFGKEVLESPERFKEAISKNISSVENYHATVDDVLAAGRAKARPLYEKVENEIVPVPEGGFKSEVRDAISQARKAYPSELDGLPDNSVKVMDYAKRVLDDDISGAIRSGQANYARSRTGITKELVEHMDRSVPGYKDARAVAGDYLGTTKAMDDGKNFMKTDPEVLSKAFSKMSDQEKIAFKIGVGKQLRDQVEKRIEGSNPYNSVLGSNTQKQRLMKVLSPTEYRNLETSLRAEDRLLRLRNEVLGGSPTASKTIAAGMIADAGQEALSALATGNIKSFGFSTVTGAVKKAFDGLNDKTATEVAKIIYETDPTKKLQILDAIAGSKTLTKVEAAAVKKAYFQAADVINPRQAAAASSGGMQPDKNRREITVTVRPKKD